MAAKYRVGTSSYQCPLCRRGRSVDQWSRSCDRTGSRMAIVCEDDLFGVYLLDGLLEGIAGCIGIVHGQES